MSEDLTDRLHGIQEKLHRLRRNVQARAIKEWRHANKHHGDKIDFAQQWLEAKGVDLKSLTQRLSEKLKFS